MVWGEKYSGILGWTTDQLTPLEDDSIALPKFDSNLAWEIGNSARNLAIEKFPKQPVVIDITLTSGQVLFHATSGNGTALDNDDWVRRKRNAVFKFGKSSLFLGAKVRSKGVSMTEALYVSVDDYACHGGCVPIRLKGSDIVIGALTISGLAQTDDHIVAIETLKKFS